jgi:large subunit ribosomal protein L4
MPEVAVRNVRNETVRRIVLSDEVFAAPLHRHLLYIAVRAYRNTGRAGTHATKNRKDVSGGTKKLWRQKGTGRARVGDNRSPLWRHGGTVHGPQPRDYSQHLPKEMRRGALRAALSQKLRDEQLVVVDRLELESPKTRQLEALLADGLGLHSKVLIVYDGEANRNLELAARNNPRVKAVRALGLNVYDLLGHEFVVASEAALGRVSEVLSR